MKKALLILAGVVMVQARPVSADDWPAFRGPTGDGLSTEKAAPTTWAKDKNIKWRTELALPGNGSPIVSNGKVFIAGAEDKEGKTRTLTCYDRKDGKELWVAKVAYGKHARTHDTNTPSSSTPASDGKVVVVWHASAGLHCYDHSGKELWKRDLGEIDHMWGEGTSPVIHNGLVFLNSGPSTKRVFVGAYKLSTGETAWEKEEPFGGDGDTNEDKKYQGSWTTPLVITSQGKSQVIFSMAKRLVAYAPEDGTLLWFCDGHRFQNGDLSYSSPVVAGDICVSITGFGGPAMGVKLGGSGDVTASNRVWRSEKNPENIGSGVLVDGKLYMPFKGPNLIACIDPATGKYLWKERATPAQMWGSMTYAAGKIYVTDQKGRTLVIKPSPEKYEALATNDLGEASNSTPAVSDGEIFIRTFKGLYCIAGE